MVLPAMFGMIFGVSIQRYLNQDKFRVVTLILLCIGGVYLIYRSTKCFDIPQKQLFSFQHDS